MFQVIQIGRNSTVDFCWITEALLVIIYEPDKRLDTGLYMDKLIHLPHIRVPSLQNISVLFLVLNPPRLDPALANRYIRHTIRRYFADNRLHWRIACRYNTPALRIKVLDKCVIPFGVVNIKGFIDALLEFQVLRQLRSLIEKLEKFAGPCKCLVRFEAGLYEFRKP